MCESALKIVDYFDGLICTGCDWHATWENVHRLPDDVQMSMLEVVADEACADAWATYVRYSRTKDEQAKGPGIVDPCVRCGQETAYGSGRFVNRIPGDHVDEETGEVRDGYMCAECCAYECEQCDKPVFEDEETWVTGPGGFRYVFHPQCVPVELAPYVEGDDE